MSVAYSHAPTDPRVRRHCETLVRRGWRVYQLGLAAEGEPPVGHLNGVVLVRWRRPRYRGRRILRYVGAYIGFWLWVRLVLRWLGRRRQVHIVQVNNLPNFLIWAATGMQRCGAGVVLDMRDPEPELFVSKWGERPGAALAGRLLASVERAAARVADATLCVHAQMRSALEARGTGNGRLRVVINAPDATVFPALPPRLSQPAFVYHGTVVHRVGLDVVVEAAARLRAQGRAVTLRIIGDGDAVPDLRRLTDERKLGAWVTVDGRRFRFEEVMAELRPAGVGIVPIRRDVFTDLMLPTKLLEYARLGIPAAVTWTPTIGYYFPEDSVYFIRELTVENVATVLASVVDAPEQALARAVRAQALPIARPWQELEREYADLIDAVARKRVAS